MFSALSANLTALAIRWPPRALPLQFWFRLGVSSAQKPQQELLVKTLRRQLLNSHWSVFDNIMENSCNTLLLSLHPEHDPQGMKNVRLSTLIQLTGVGGSCDCDGTLECGH